MKTQAIRLLIVAIACATFTSLAALTQPTTPHYSHHELKQLIRDAHTPEQYQALAAYFRGEEKLFNDRAVAEKVEWDRRTATLIGPEIKSRSVESARNLYEYYAYEAAQMDTLAAGYEQRSR